MLLDKAKIRKTEIYTRKNQSSNRTSTYSEKFKGEFFLIKIENLMPFENQARVHFDEESLNSMAETIKLHGIRQPLTVIKAKTKEGFFEIVSGERRFRSALIAGLKSVPCIIMQDRNKAEEIAIIENIQRKNLHPIELFNAYTNLIENKVCSSFSEIGKKLAISKTSVAEVMMLKNLGRDVSDILVQKNIKKRELLRELCQLPLNSQLERLNSFLDKDAKAQKSKVKSLHRRAKLLEIVLENNEVNINTNRISNLDSEFKEKLKQKLNSIINSL